MIVLNTYYYARRFFNVMSNRTKISALSKIFQEIDYFLFDYNAENETLLDINKYELKDFH